MRHMHWSIRLYEDTDQQDNRMCVVISTADGSVDGFGATPREAFDAAERKLHYPKWLPIVFFGDGVFMEGL